MELPGRRVVMSTPRAPTRIALANHVNCVEKIEESVFQSTISRTRPVIISNSPVRPIAQASRIARRSVRAVVIDTGMSSADRHSATSGDHCAQSGAVARA